MIKERMQQKETVSSKVLLVMIFSEDTGIVFIESQIGFGFEFDGFSILESQNDSIFIGLVCFGNYRVVGDKFFFSVNGDCVFFAIGGNYKTCIFSNPELNEVFGVFTGQTCLVFEFFQVFSL